MMKTTNFQKLPRTYWLFRTQSSPMPSSPSHPSLKRISNLHHLTISTSKKIIQEDRSKVKLVFFNTKKKTVSNQKSMEFWGRKNSPLNWFLLYVFFGSAMIETLRGDRISGVTRTTWTKALGVIDHPKLINSNTEYDTSIVHTYRIYTNIES